MEQWLSILCRLQQRYELGVKGQGQFYFFYIYFFLYYCTMIDCLLCVDVEDKETRFQITDMTLGPKVNVK